MNEEGIQIGKLLDSILKQRFGKDFSWDKLTIISRGGDSYIIAIESSSSKEWYEIKGEGAANSTL